MAALDNIASELLKSANEADLNYKKTRDQAQRDKAVRLRRIVENLKAISAAGLTPTLDEVLTEGNTSTNTLNVGGITTDYVQLDTAATPTLAPGMFAWSDADGTANLRLKGNNVTLQVGQETLARVVNKTGSDLLESEYKVVRVRIASEGGSQGQRLAVVLAQGDNDPDSATTIGIVTENIANNQEGFITVFGNVNGINTTGSLQGETWVDGDVLYLSPTTPGSLTKVKPVAPQHTVIVGYVLYAHGVNGKIFVKVDNGYELDELHNVLITSPANNDLLQYNSTQQVWKNVAASVAVPTPTLAQVTTAGNTTTNAITVGSTFVVGDWTSRPTNVYVRAATGGAENRGYYIGYGSGNDGNGGSLTYNATTNYLSLRSPYNSGTIALSLEGNTNSVQFHNTSGTVVSKFVSSTGNLLIGTTTDAGYKLDVNGTARVATSLNVSTAGSGTMNTYLGGSVAIGNDFVNNGYILQIKSINTGIAGIYLRAGGAGGYPILFCQDANGTASTTFIVRETGNVGIGTTTPTDKLHIVDNTNGNKFGRISAGGTDASAAWVAQNDQVDNVVYRVFGSAVTGSQMGISLARSASLLANLGGSGKFLVGTFSSTDFVMGTGNQERMRLVDSTGNFLIGTTTDIGNKLEVSGTINATAYKINNVIGYTGILNIPTNPPGQQNVDIQSGIVVNIF